MNIKVTKDNVCIIERGNVHEGEYKVNELSFDFSEEYMSDLVINAVFTNELGKAYQVSVIDNKCHIPAEILDDTGQVVLGVYAYQVNGEELELRYSPFPTSFVVLSGSYDPTAEESQEITPTQYEQYMQALQNGLNQVQESISELDKATDSANDLVDEINKKLENGEFIGPQGQIGPQGEPGKDGTNGVDGVGITTITSGQATEENGNTITPITVEKTDGSSETFNVSAKNGVDGKDGQNGKDGINGTNGVDGQDGITPNIQIGDVTTLEPTEQATVTRTGTDEEPVFNFGIPKGDKGDPGEVTEDTLDNVIPKQTATDSIININDALKYKSFGFKVDGNYEQKTSDGSNLLDIDYSINPVQGEKGDIQASLNDDYSFTATGQRDNTEYSNIYFDLLTDLNIKQGVQYYIHDITLVLLDSGLNWIKNQFDNFIADGNYIVKRFYWATNKTGSINEIIRPYVGTVPYDESKYYKYTGGIASPNPDYPQEITPLSFDKIIKIGQNLLPNTFYSKNADCSIDDDGWVSVTFNNSGGTSNQYFNVYYDSAKLKPNKNYNVILEVKELSGTGTMFVCSNAIFGEQKEGQFSTDYRLTFSSLQSGKIYNKICLTKTNLDNIVTSTRSFVQADPGQAGSITFRISILEDTSVAPDNFVYQPYKEDNYSIDLQDNEMVSLPNGVKDELTIDKDGSVSLVKKVGKKILIDTDVAGIEYNWFSLVSFSNIAKPLDYIGEGTYALDISYNNIVLNKFYQSPESAPRETYDKVYSIIPYMSGWSFGITFPKNTTIEEAREIVNGTILYYQLKEPQTIPLGKLSDIITTEQGSNTFAINSNIDTQISATYALNIKKYIDNKIATVSQAVLEQE